MARVKHGVASRQRRKKILKAAKGAVGGRSKLLRTAKETVRRAMAYSYRDRLVRKRVFRQLWIARISAQAINCGISYNKLINGLKKAKVLLDRKMLAEIAVNDSAAFSKIVEIAKSHI